MNKVVKILMERDGLTKEEAEELLESVKEECYRAIDEEKDYLVEDIILDDLGLEMDYIYDVLY